MLRDFTLKAEPFHVEIDFSDTFLAGLDALRRQAEEDGAGRSGPYEPEVEFLLKVIVQLRRELPAMMARAQWPPALGVGDKLDEFILTTIKDPARAARGRGTNASAKLAIARLSVGVE